MIGKPCSVAVDKGIKSSLELPEKNSKRNTDQNAPLGVRTKDREKKRGGHQTRGRARETASKARVWCSPFVRTPQTRKEKN